MVTIEGSLDVSISYSSYLVRIYLELTRILCFLTAGPLPAKRALILPTGWSSLGCVTEGQSFRALKDFAYASSTMTVESCLEVCKGQGFSLGGLEWSNEYVTSSFSDSSISIFVLTMRLGLIGLCVLQVLLLQQLVWRRRKGDRRLELQHALCRFVMTPFSFSFPLHTYGLYRH